MLFEIEKDPLLELLQKQRKKVVDQMIVFLLDINLFQEKKTDEVEMFASKGEIREYKKGEVVLQEEDFPLHKFFIVKDGKINLYKRVEVERCNYMPTTKNSYQKRSYLKTVPHCLGHVLPRQYFGIEESLMDMAAG